MSENLNGGLALAILAAGISKRFGDGDKLSAMLGRKMLGLHAAETLSALPVDHRYIVASTGNSCGEHWMAMGYQLIPNDQGAEGQAHSVALAATAAQEAGASGLIICLADMPFVTTIHVSDLISAFHDSNGSEIIASTTGDHPMPPAIFPASTFDRLISLEGDKGARALLKSARKIPVNERQMMDIDTPEELARANQLIQ